MERVKLDLEFVIKSSPTILFQYLSTPSGLVEWFCDDVNIKGSKEYTFFWDGEEHKAELVKKVNGKLIKFKLLENAADEFFQFEVTKDELTGDIGLLITDFVDADEVADMNMVWESQVMELKHALGLS
ncbi:START-like domain-containing protein [Bacteroidia bacterium]|nr:START-like domain-containing protein [Bacteroidia bacterium]MDC1395037.1 START-like domain-containing protein [Bacteroidia bacterium]